MQIQMHVLGEFFSISLLGGVSVCKRLFDFLEQYLRFCGSELKENW